MDVGKGKNMAEKITAGQLQRKLENGEKVEIIDVREQAEAAQGKIPGAKNIPLGQLAIRKGELDKTQTYAIVCQSGNRSKAACGILAALGYKAVDVAGGMNEWKGNLE